MSRTFGMVAAAALLASVTAFAQNEPSSSSDKASASAAAPADDSANAEKPMKHHRHHGSGGHMATGSRGTDMNADRLNACMSNATPTSQQEQCLKSASGTGNG